MDIWKKQSKTRDICNKFARKLISSLNNCKTIDNFGKTIENQGYLKQMLTENNGYLEKTMDILEKQRKITNI